MFSQRRNGAKFFRFNIQGALLFGGVFLFGPAPLSASAAQQISAPDWARLTSDTAFAYKNELENAHKPSNFHANGWQKLLQGIFGFFNSGIASALLWTLVVGVVCYLLYRLVLKKDSFLFARSKKDPGDKDAPGMEGTDTADWEALTHKAVSDNDTRLAVRYSYMWLLQLLQQHGLIQYRTDKTNYEYYSELQHTSYRQPFKNLSRQYEYAWYGNFAPSPDAYSEYMNLFNSVKKELGA